MITIISPNVYVPKIRASPIFLAGPIRSAPEWHKKAIEYLTSREDNLTIISPNRIGEEIIPSSKFSRQREWERYYLDVARKKGCVIFWLPEEEEHNCNKVYGAMSRFELGQMFTYYKLDNSTKFCVGSDGKFPELHTIKYDLFLDSPDKEIFPTLEETCEGALRLIKLK